MDSDNTKDTALVTRPIGAGSQALDVRDASAEGVKLMAERVENQKKMLAIAIRLTSPSQWTVFSGTDKTTGKLKESIYPTGGAADTILRRAFGLTWGEKRVEVTRDEDGESVAVCTAWLMQGDRRIEEFEGRRKLGGFIRTESDMRKGAVENMKSVAVRDLLGLRFRSASELREMGLDVGEMQNRAEFQNRGGEDEGAAVVPFGKNKGTPVTDLKDKQLDWYVEAAEKSVADPAKAKWRAKEEKWLGALKAEKARRANTGATETGGGEHDYGPPPMDADREPGADG